MLRSRAASCAVETYTECLLALNVLDDDSIVCYSTCGLQYFPRGVECASS